MIKKIKAIIRENRENQSYIKKNQDYSIRLNQEIEWAHIYHDSIRGKEWLNNLPLNIGRWAGSYPFFYVLNRILNDFKPQSILELGLGESSKFISTYLDHYLFDSEHLVIEQDENWKNSFEGNFKLSQRTQVMVCPLKKVTVNGFETNSYQNIETEVNRKFDVYVVDGPIGTLNYSRYDILKIVQILNNEDQFIIIVDDYNRSGERETVVDLLKLLASKGIKVFTNCYNGNKSILVIATENYKYSISF